MSVNLQAWKTEIITPVLCKTLVTAPAEVSIMTNADQSQWCVLTKQMGGEIQMPPLTKLGLQLIISVL